MTFTVEPDSIVTSTETKHGFVIVYDGDPKPLNLAPPNFQPINDFVSELEQDPKIKDQIQKARKAVKETFYPEEITLKSLRLCKGWSQTQLAEKIGSSQSHVAKMESGKTDRIYLETFRKLCSALDVDMTTMDRAFQQQEKASQ